MNTLWIDFKNESMFEHIVKEPYSIQLIKKQGCILGTDVLVLPTYEVTN